MARQLSGIDISMLVTGILGLILTVSLFGVAGSISGDVKVNNYAEVELQFAVAAWYLLTSIFAIASGASGHRGPYIAVIVLAILAIFVAVAGAILAILFIYYNEKSHKPYFPIYSTTYSPWESEQNVGVRNAIIAELGGLPYGVMIINIICFIMFIIISSIACCGTCCNSSPQPTAQSTTIVTTSGGFTTTAGPPGYVSQPPVGQQYVFQGMSNPNYDGNTTVNPYDSAATSVVVAKTS